MAFQTNILRCRGVQEFQYRKKSFLLLPYRAFCQVLYLTSL